MASGTVVVTGASTGIGEAAALHLRERGFDVRAGVRNEEDAERLRAAGVSPLRLDVTDAESIAVAAEELGDAPLAGLVNNAGIAVSAPLEFVPIHELRRQLNVNVIGQVAVTQAFLPALRRGQGRIVNVSSIGGRIALPLAGPYAASKFALEGLSDSLRREVAQFGIEVSLVEPGGVKTPIWDKGTKTAEQIAISLPPEAGQLYGRMVDVLRRETVRIAETDGMEPERVARVIGHALTSRKPKTRYLVGRDAKLRWAVAKRVPDRVFDRLIARVFAGDQSGA
jgi:NAD(P)-dependent dehydrogenase (short-subunit alcohol dehydrogenase family)